MARRQLIHPMCQQLSTQLPELLSWFSRSSSDLTIKPTRSLRRARRRLQLEPLESRQMMSVSPSVGPAAITGVVGSQGVEPIDGVGNNIANPTLGAANTDFVRITAANFADGIDAPNGQNLPSARVISNLTASQDVAGIEQDENNDRSMSDWVYAWGQFIDHDIDLTESGTVPMNIPVPAGDPTFDPTDQGNLSIAFDRSQTAPGTGTSTSNPAQFVNQDTSFIDGSMIYGSDATTAADLRTFVGGQLKTSAGDLLPYNTMGLNMADNIGVPEDTLFAAGDVRANENVELTNITTLFVREHNYQAALLAKEHPTWNDQQLYNGARQIVIGEIQSITYNEWLPALMGNNALTPYRGYNPNVDPAISDGVFQCGISTSYTDRRRRSIPRQQWQPDPCPICPWPMISSSPALSPSPAKSPAI